MSYVNATDLSLCHRAAAQKPDAAARRLGCERRCRHFAPGSSQRCRKALKLANVACKYLSLKEIRSKTMVSCLGFAVAFSPFSRKRVCEIARSSRMHLKRFNFNAILSAGNFLAVEKLDQFWNDLIRRFFHQPVPLTLEDHALDISRHQPALLDQEITARLLSGQHQHRHRQRRP